MLHPLVEGGLRALSDDPAHAAAMREHGIRPIDLLCVNLYPFRETVASPGATFDEAVENIDIGGPAMIRAAAKNHRYVLVVTSPDRYEKVLGDLREHGGSCCGAHRLKQARRAFAHTAEYDAAIARYLLEGVEPRRHEETTEELPDSIDLSLKLKQSLRYGENPHQRAGLYVDATPHAASKRRAAADLARATQLHGKELSYINLLDADAALACAEEFTQPAACIVKHATPCGVGSADSLADAFGGIVAVNREIDHAAAEAIVGGQKFLEVIVAPSFAADALDLVRSRWKNVRLLACGTGLQPVSSLRITTIAGGYLVQEPDSRDSNDADWKVVSKRPPTEQEQADLRFAWLACKHVKSNAIVLASGGATVGIGGGQVDRVGAARIAIDKAAGRAKGAVAASDAFFPFADGPKLLLSAGIAAIIQPGGSVRDEETIASVNDAGAAMIFTGRRHFRH
jgi:phosphoribosylaminoimidazolecarboxamide formyltransferase / IMP cyclohydrolase